MPAGRLRRKNPHRCCRHCCSVASACAHGRTRCCPRLTKADRRSLRKRLPPTSRLPEDSLGRAPSSVLENFHRAVFPRGEFPFAVRLVASFVHGVTSCVTAEVRARSSSVFRRGELKNSTCVYGGDSSIALSFQQRFRLSSALLLMEFIVCAGANTFLTSSANLDKFQSLHVRCFFNTTRIAFAANFNALATPRGYLIMGSTVRSRESYFSQSNSPDS